MRPRSHLEPPSAASHRPGPFVVVRFGRLGDMVMITPALRTLLERAGDRRVVLLTTPVGGRLLRDFDPALTLRVIERRGWRRLTWARRTRRWIRDQAPAGVWLFESAPRFRRLVAGVDCPVQALGPTDSVVHFADRCLGLIDPPGPRRWAELSVRSPAKQKAEALLRHAGLPPDVRLIGLHPGFSGVEPKKLDAGSDRPHPKAWPVESWAALARTLRERTRGEAAEVAVVMSLPERESEVGRRIAAASGDAVIRLPAVSDLATYAALLQRYDVLVAPDTGPGHLAAAVGTPVVSLFAQRDPSECAPFTAPERLSVLRVEETPHPERGLASLSPGLVAEAVLGLRSRHGARVRGA